MTLKYIRDYYQVPAALFVRVVADGEPGTIVGYQEGALLVQLDDQSPPAPWHPTWHMRYEPALAGTTENLTDVEAGEVYLVEQPAGRYAFNRRTVRRMTRPATQLVELGLIASTGRVTGPSTDYVLTDEGTATLAVHRRLLADGPVDRTGDDAAGTVTTIRIEGNVL